MRSRLVVSSRRRYQRMLVFVGLKGVRRLHEDGLSSCSASGSGGHLLPGALLRCGGRVQHLHLRRERLQERVEMHADGLPAGAACVAAGQMPPVVHVSCRRRVEHVPVSVEWDEGSRAVHQYSVPRELGVPGACR